jgi:5-formyltetrahydrofolate cyclo-ligase
MSNPSTDTTMATRERIWRELRKVALPDSRFHWDFSSFIPDFAGSHRCNEKILTLDAYRNLGNRRLFVTPDNSTEDLRRHLLFAHRPFVMTTYGIVRGFLRIDSANVPDGEERYAATLDGADRYGKAVTMDELRHGPPFGLLITGSAAVSVSGVRFGKGHGYFDLEWAMLSELGLVDEQTIIVAVVHDCQVVHEPLPAKPHDVIVDWIVTPQHTLRINHGGRPVGKLRWEELRSGGLAELGVIAELRQILGVRNG